MLETEDEAAAEGDDLMPAKAPKLLVAAALVEARLEARLEVGVVHALVATVRTAEDAAFRCGDDDEGTDVLCSPGTDPPAAAAAASSLLSSESYSCSSMDWLCWNDMTPLLRRRPLDGSDLGCCLDTDVTS